VGGVIWLATSSRKLSVRKDGKESKNSPHEALGLMPGKLCWVVPLNFKSSDIDAYSEVKYLEATASRHRLLSRFRLLGGIVTARRRFDGVWGRQPRKLEIPNTDVFRSKQDPAVRRPEENTVVEYWATFVVLVWAKSLDLRSKFLPCGTNCSSRFAANCATSAACHP